MAAMYNLYLLRSPSSSSCRLSKALELTCFYFRCPCCSDLLCSLSAAARTDLSREEELAATHVGLLCFFEAWVSSPLALSHGGTLYLGLTPFFFYLFMYKRGMNEQVISKKKSLKIYFNLDLWSKDRVRKLKCYSSRRGRADLRKDRQEAGGRGDRDGKARNN